jgi:hypothetical protein
MSRWRVGDPDPLNWGNHNSEDEYDVAQICLNGHVINSMMKASPHRSQDYCHHCGEATISECQNCETPIKGRSWSTALITYYPPSFCYACGLPFPWTTRKLKAAQELASELEGLDDDERDLLSRSIDDLVKDTPSTSLAAQRMKKIFRKVGKDAYEAFRDILVDIVSDTARKVLWPE